MARCVAPSFDLFFIEPLEIRRLLASDLTGSFVSKTPAELSVGGHNTITLQVSNKGKTTASGKFTVSLYASSNGTTLAAAGTLGTTTIKSFKLAGGTSTNVPITFNSPTSIPTGKYRLVARVNSTNRIQDAHPANNIFSTKARVSITQPTVDLTGKISVIPAGPLTLPLAKAVTFSLAIKNAGNMTAAGKLGVQLYASTDTVLDSTDVPLLAISSHKVSITPGKKATTFTITGKPAADSVPSGIYYILAEINPNKTIAESDTTNDLLVSTQTLVVDNPALPVVPRVAPDLSSDVSFVVIGHPEVVRFSVKVVQATPNTAVEVDEFNADGSLVGKVTDLVDDGDVAFGDSVAGDAIYNGVTTVGFNAPGARYFKAIVSDPVLVVPATTTVRAIPGINAPSTTQLETDAATSSNINHSFSGTLSSGGSPQDALAAVKEALKADPNVQASSIVITHTTIQWKTADGVPQGISTDLANPAGLSLSTPPDASAFSSLAPITSADDSSDDNDGGTESVLLLSPFYSSLASYDPNSTISSMFTSAGYDVTSLQNQNVTLESFKNLGQYDAVELYGHGTQLGDGGEGIYTSIPFSVSTALSYAWDLLNGRLDVMNGFFVITPAYISAYTASMDGTIVNINACNSAHDSQMADAFLDRGAGAYIGYSETVLASFATGKAVSTFQTLLDTDHNTVGDIPGINTDHDASAPAAYFREYGPLSATLPQPGLLKNNDVYVRYAWPQTQHDLDTNTSFLGTDAGWHLENNSPFLNWSGDDTSAGGVETTTVDLYESWLDSDWSTSTTVGIGADWYEPADGSGPAFVTVALQNKHTGKLSHLTTRTISPNTENSGAHTSVGTIDVTLAGDPENPTIKIELI